MNFYRAGGGGNQYVSDNILQLVGACYVSSRPNAVSKSPANKLNESTSANPSFSNNRFAIIIKP